MVLLTLQQIEVSLTRGLSLSQRFLLAPKEVGRFVGPAAGKVLFVLVGLIALAACSSYTSDIEPTTNPLAQDDSPPPAVEQVSQDQPTAVEPTTEISPEPELRVIPLVTSTANDPEDLINSALDQALRGDIQGVYQMSRSGDPAYIPVLMDLLRFSRGFPADDMQLSILLALSDIAEQNFPEFVAGEATTWSWWVKWLGRNPETKPPPGYAAWKGRLYGQLVDPEMGAFLYSGVKTNIRLEEIVWGGVPKDGIPDLTNPPVINAEEADYLDAEERVFGVSFNGEYRAYPHRILNAHEMANDVVGGVPFALAY